MLPKLPNMVGKPLSSEGIGRYCPAKEDNDGVRMTFEFWEGARLASPGAPDEALAARLAEAGSLDAIMLDADGALAGLLGCERFTLYAVDADGDYLVSSARTAAGACRDVKVAITPHSIAGHAVLARQVVGIADAYDDAELARIAPGLRFARGVDQRTGYRTRQVLAVPVCVPGTQTVLGVIQLVNARDGRPFGALAADGAARLAELLPAWLPVRPTRAQASAPAIAAIAAISATPIIPATPVIPATPAGEPGGAPAPAAHAVVAAPPAGDAARLFARIVADARRLGASAIHLEPGAGRCALRLRRDGALVPYASLPAARAGALVAHLEALGGLAAPGTGTARCGTIRCGGNGAPELRLHVTALASTAGEEVVLRVAPPAVPVPLAQLGMAPDELARLRAAIAPARGLFLVAGPADAGKTTTLHALLACLNSPDRKIWTAEDPVTIAQPGLRQVPVGSAAGPDFAGALRAFRDADADVIMVGALHDRESAGLAMEAALAGRMVLAALPAGGAPEAALRLSGMGLDPFGAAGALLGVLAQRLVKRLCAACRQAYHPGAAELELLLTEYCEELQPASSTTLAAATGAGAVRARVLAGWRERHGGADGRFTLYRAVGCGQCHGGYRGRAGLFELMTAGGHAAPLLARRPDAAQLKAAALQDGMRTLKMDGIGKVLAGITDIRMVRAACAR